MASKDPIQSPLVAEGRALLARLEKLTEKLKAKSAELEPIQTQIKEAKDALGKVNDQLIELGAGPYADPDGHTATVVAGVPAKMAPDTFVLPDGADDEARELAGEFFPKLFNRIVTHEPRNGFDAIADALLTPAKARKLVALCIVPGGPTGGRKASVRWA